MDYKNTIRRAVGQFFWIIPTEAGAGVKPVGSLGKKEGTFRLKEEDMLIVIDGFDRASYLVLAEKCETPMLTGKPFRPSSREPYKPLRFCPVPQA